MIYLCYWLQYDNENIQVTKSRVFKLVYLFIDRDIRKQPLHHRFIKTLNLCLAAC